jgi:hypothetical protein
MVGFNLLVFGLLMAVAVKILTEYRDMRLRSPVKRYPESPFPACPRRNGATKHAAVRIIGLTSYV